MGANNGSGQPFWFKCSHCGRGRTEVTLTGRKRKKEDGRSRGRSTNRLREFKCPCGHVGWSRHVDLGENE